MEEKLHVSEVELRNFRCFEHIHCAFPQQFTLCEGANGTGKTALLEALAYACYLRSFRTHAPREIIRWENEGFFIKLKGTNNLDDTWDLSVAVTGNRRIIKCDGVSITSFHDLFATYRSISIIGDDLKLVAGFPDERRLFLDQAITLANQGYSAQLRSLRTIVRQRNALLAQPSLDNAAYSIWTERLELISKEVRGIRKTYLTSLESTLKKLSEKLAGPLSRQSLTLSYQEQPQTTLLKDRELRLHRSLYGAHLDDVVILWQGRPARLYASRGQQKLIVLLLKIAQACLLTRLPIILIDDFATDFDDRILNSLLNLIFQLKMQAIFTAPSGSTLRHSLKKHPFSSITL
ncbi:MAG: DNA replication/repair protein RecF [Candidatus Babeliaceae bacterium]|nr:DNA replication/repair protein RecF [Candidatus Babeliaceae bacterium]